MKLMKALVLQEKKNFDSLGVQTMPYPTPGSGEVTVRLKACALNHRDIWIIKGLYPGIKTPVILGSDGAGTVHQVGKAVEKDWLKKEVIINPSLDWGENSRVQQERYRILGLPDNGTQAEFVTIPVSNVCEKPQYLSFQEAAAIPLAGLTGYRALFTQGKLSADDTILITGIGGGVGALMLRMAVAVNATVLVTSGSDRKIETAVKAGAKGGVNYNRDNWGQEIMTLAGEEGVHLIIDCAGGDGFEDLLSIVNPGGRMVVFGATRGNPSSINLRKLFWKQITLQGSTMGNDNDFAQMLIFFQSYQIKPFIDGPYPMSQFRSAYQLMMDGEQFGKIVLVNEFG